VIDIQAALREPDIGRQDLADILKDVQAQEKQNLSMVSVAEQFQYTQTSLIALLWGLQMGF